MDPFLEQLETINGYRISDSHSISSLVFADDLLLLAATKEDAQRLLLHTVRYLHILGMKMAAAKCTSFEIKETEDFWYIAEPDLHLGDGAQIPFSAADSVLTWEAIFPLGMCYITRIWALRYKVFYTAFGVHLPNSTKIYTVFPRSSSPISYTRPPLLSYL